MAIVAALRRSWERLAATLRPSGRDEDFRVELEAHVEMMIEERVARGMSREAARREAHQRLGGVAQLAESHREWRGVSWLEGTGRDLFYAFRSLRRDRTFVLAAVGIVALGIGATTAAYSVVNRTYFRPLPYAEEEQLVSLGITLPWVQQEFLFGRAYVQLREQLASGMGEYGSPFRSVTSMLGVQDCEADNGSRAPHRFDCAQVEWNFLSVLGVLPERGGDFTQLDDAPEAPPTALLSHAAWVARFGSDAAAAGGTIVLNGHATKIKGVLPASFELPTGEPFDLLVPQRVDYRQQSMATPGKVFRVFGRLRHHSYLLVASRFLDVLMAAGPDSAPAEARRQMGFQVRLIRDLRLRDARLAAWLLLGGTGSIFVIACGNAGFLLLARAAARRREKAIRTALGATGMRHFRQTMAEALLIALPGGLIGCGLAFLLLRLLPAALPAELADAAHVTLEIRAVAAAFLLATLAAMGFGLAPLLAERTPVSISSFQTAGSSRRGHWFREGLVVGQIALSIVLVAGASAMLQGLWQLRADRFRLQPDQKTVASFILGKERYSDPQRRAALFSQLEDRLRAIPGVQAAAVADSVPPTGITRSHPMSVLESSVRGGVVLWRFVSAGYFPALGIPVVQGRAFVESDSRGGPVIVVNQALARRLFPKGDAVGRTLPVSGAPAEIVGVAGDISNGNIAGPPAPEYYVLRNAGAVSVHGNQMPPHGWRRASVVVRSPLPVDLVKRILQAEISALDPGISVTTETMDDRFSRLSERPRFHAVVLAGFGLIGLVLSGAGLYGLVAYLSEERAREFSVRIALGAAKGNIERLVLSLAARWVLLGGVLGAVLSYAAGRMLRSLSHELGPIEPRSYFAALAVLTLVGVLSAWRPARRAAMVDPIRVLRAD